MSGMGNTSARKSSDQQTFSTQDQTVNNLNAVDNTVSVTVTPQLNRKVGTDSTVCK